MRPAPWQGPSRPGSPLMLTLNDVYWSVFCAGSVCAYGADGASAGAGCQNYSHQVFENGSRDLNAQGHVAYSIDCSTSSMGVSEDAASASESDDSACGVCGSETVGSDGYDGDDEEVSVEVRGTHGRRSTRQASTQHKENLLGRRHRGNR